VPDPGGGEAFPPAPPEEPPSRTWRPPRAGRFRRAVRVFISSPGDLQAERDLVAGVVKRLQELPVMARRFAFQTLMWEHAVPRVIGERIQPAIDAHLGESGEADLFVMLMGGRLGTEFIHDKTGVRYASGTEYELDLAYLAYRRRGRPLILAYRCRRPGLAVDATEADRLQAFWASFERRYRTQPCEFAEPQTLQDLLYRHLGALVERFDRRDKRLRRLLVACVLSLGIVLGWATHVGWLARDLARKVDAIIATAIADQTIATDPGPVWERARRLLVALGPGAVPPILGVLERKDILHGMDPTPLDKVAQALADDANAGARDQVCAGFRNVLTPHSEPRYTKAVHRSVIQYGFGGTTCDGSRDFLCAYLGHLSSGQFLDHAADLLDLRDAAVASGLLDAARAAQCLQQGGS